MPFGSCCCFSLSGPVCWFTLTSIDLVPVACLCAAMTRASVLLLSQTFSSHWSDFPRYSSAHAGSCHAMAPALVQCRSIPVAALSILSAAHLWVLSCRCPTGCFCCILPWPAHYADRVSDGWQGMCVETVPVSTLLIVVLTHWLNWN